MRAPAGTGEPGSAAAPPLLWIRLLGEPDLRAGDERLPPLESTRALSLLAYLVLHDEALPRQRLAFLLWPDSAEGQARTNLRHLLHVVRRANPMLERHLDVTPQTLRWRREVPCRLDVADVEAALACADEPDAAPQAVADALRHAVDLYEGDLLEGCYDDWVIEARERLRDLHAATLQRLVTLLVELGQPADAIRFGRELLRLDPLREDWSRLLMHAHGAAGDRAGAVRVYHQCASTLQRELGVDPSATTASAYAAVVRAAPAPAPTDPAQRQAHAGQGQLVGRDDEWKQLTGWWIEAERGRARLVLVTGEPGVGKTRLVEELAAWCTHRGAVVAQARSYANEGSLGFGPVVSWLRTAEVATRLRRADDSQLVELVRLLPELGILEGAPAPEKQVGPAQRRRLFDEIRWALLVEDRPVMLVADDAQWCDEESLQLIHYLVRHDSGGRLLVVGTARREDLDGSHPLGSIEASLQAIDRSSEIPLGRLGDAATGELARHLWGRELDEETIDRLQQETEGNPLFIVEARRAVPDGEAPTGSRLSPKLQAVIAGRLRQLSGPAREVLGVAAAVGRDFTAEVVGRAAGVDDLALVAALDELWRRGIIREQGLDAYDFTHGKLREVAYDELSQARRRRCHLVIARVLADVNGGNLDMVSGELARHLERAAQAAEAAAWYVRAAVQAQHQHANVEAVRLLDRAAELVAALPPGSDRLDLEIDVLSALPTPLAVVQGFASPRLAETQRRALELAAAAGVEPAPTLMRSIVMSNLCRTDFHEARAAALRLRELAEQKADDVLLVETEYLLGIGAFWDGALGTARTHFTQVLARFEPQRRREHLLRFGHDPAVVCLSRLANTLWFLGEPEEARRVREEAVAMAAEVGHPFSRGVALIFAALVSVDLGDLGSYRDFVAAFEGSAQHLPFELAHQALLGYLDVLDGQADRGIQRIWTSVSASSMDQAPGQRATHARLLLAAYDALGDAEAGLVAADEVLAIGGTRLWEAEARRLRARFLADRRGPPAEIEAELDRAVAAAHRLGAAGPERRVERWRSAWRAGGTSLAR